MKLLLPTLLCLQCCFHQSFAQSTGGYTAEMIARAYEDSTIYLVGNDTYYKRGERHRVGFFLSNLRAEIAKSPEAFESFKTARRKKWRGAALMNGSLFFGMTALILTPSPLVILFLVPYSWGIVELLDSERHLHHAVWLLNRDQMLKALQR